MLISHAHQSTYPSIRSWDGRASWCGRHGGNGEKWGNGEMEAIETRRQRGHWCNRNVGASEMDERGRWGSFDSRQWRFRSWWELERVLSNWTVAQHRSAVWTPSFPLPIMKLPINDNKTWQNDLLQGPLRLRGIVITRSSRQRGDCDKGNNEVSFAVGGSVGADVIQLISEPLAGR